MRNVISFPIRTYVDFETLPTSKEQTTQKPNHDGTLVKISVNPATVLTDNHKTELVNFVRRFRQWKWKGSKHVVVPVARAPVDPAHITYNANQPSIDPFDLMLFHAYKRWKNNFQTIPPPSQNFAERYFLMDPSWRKASLLRPFSMFTRPYVNNISQMMQTSHFTIPNGTATDFDPSRLHAFVDPDIHVSTGMGMPRPDVRAIVTGSGSVPAAADPVVGPTGSSDVNNHRHNLYQQDDGDIESTYGVLCGNLHTYGLIDKAKALITGENTIPEDKLVLSGRWNNRLEAGPTGHGWSQGLDQANLTGYVATTSVESNKPADSPSSVQNWGTTTEHSHSMSIDRNMQVAMASQHYHAIDGDKIEEMQTKHVHDVAAGMTASRLEFSYDDGRLDPTQIPPQSLPWWSTSSDSFISGRRRVRGWQDTRQASFITGAMTDSVYSPTWPAFLWRIPCHYHTKYAFRMWITHWFSLRSPILHELFVPTTDAVDGMLQEEGVSVLDMKIRTPSAVAGIEGFTPETNEWIKSILTNADAEIQQQFTDQPTD